MSLQVCRTTKNTSERAEQGRCFSVSAGCGRGTVKIAPVLKWFKELKRWCCILSHLRRPFHHFFGALNNLEPRVQDENKRVPHFDGTKYGPNSHYCHFQRDLSTICSCQHSIVLQKKQHLNYSFLSKLCKPGEKVKKNVMHLMFFSLIIMSPGYNSLATNWVHLNDPVHPVRTHYWIHRCLAV